MPRQARLDSPGTLHHVMIRGIERRNIVDEEQDRKDFVRRLGKLASETFTAIYAWALMSNHAHILLSTIMFFGTRGKLFCKLINEEMFSCPLAPNAKDW
jgi:REP element-mobilizing transposase RayT